MSKRFIVYLPAEVAGQAEAVWVAACKAVGGAVTLNVPIDLATGRIPARSAQQLERLGDRLSSRARPPAAV
jgi:hypothetical protein